MLRRASRIPTSQEPGVQMSWISRAIAIGGVWRSDAWPQAYRAGVRAVVDVQHAAGDLGPFVRSEGMRYLRLCLEEGATPVPEELHIVSSWVLERGAREGPVLIQDLDGRNNDALLACASLIKTGQPYDDAIQVLAGVRPNAVLTSDQTRALLRFTSELTAAR